jgi:ketosteroid isomerase-like protein
MRAIPDGGLGVAPYASGETTEGGEMSTEQTAREMLRAFNANDAAAFRAVLEDGFIYREYATHREAHTGDEAVAMIFPWKEALGADHHGDLVRLVVSGDVAVMEVTWRGRHVGPLSLPDGTVVPPTDAVIEAPACMVMTARDGKLTEMNHYFDALELLIRVGVIPAPATA